MTTNFQKTNSRELKNRKWQPSWDTIINVNEVRSKAKEARLKKEGLYHQMVGSVRELRRKMKAIGEI